MNLSIECYTNELRALWNDTLLEVRQSSFLFHRDFMEYHKDRFVDLSLIIFDAHHNVLALFPANECRNNPCRVESHGGLTYGGLLLTPQATAKVVNEMLSAISVFYHKMGYTELLYKPVPHIYQTYPSDEDLYALFLHHADLSTRSVSSVIDLRQPWPLSKLRKRKVKKADQILEYKEVSGLHDVAIFWRMLCQVLSERHHTKPVHSLVELQYLISRFPQQMRLYMACVRDKVSKETASVAGCLLFISERVIHVQYIASSDEGCGLGALDGLFNHLLQFLPNEYPHIPYFDFGISTEEGGRYLNEGLIFQKEGLGGRAVCYDSYILNLE